MKEEEKGKKEKYRGIFKGLYSGLQRALRDWERQDGGWDMETWMLTLEAITGAFQDYREAEQWIRKQVLGEKQA